ncbi:hypothetical protein V8G54_012575 [Vigna mungo]|uniref:S-protein homolog n=1 Tax=Vigna mungo TaxID=3915 RepID=A0AAQ3S0Q7_VIGMU
MVIISKIALLHFLLLTTLFSLQPKGSEDEVLPLEVEDNIFNPSRVYIKIVNSMVLKNLTLHCQDKHHDLGIHILNYHDAFKFSFKPSPIIKVTLYFCRFVWEQTLHYFDIYKETRDDCTECVWNIFETGPCLMQPRSNKCYAWNK